LVHHHSNVRADDLLHDQNHGGGRMKSNDLRWLKQGNDYQLQQYDGKKWVNMYGGFVEYNSSDKPQWIAKPVTFKRVKSELTSNWDNGDFPNLVSALRETEAQAIKSMLSKDKKK
jgi:hypothetical protein